MSLPIADTLRVSLILLVALGAAVLLHRRSAAVRHWVLAVAIGCAAATPLLGLVMPSWQVGLAAFLPSRAEQRASIVSTTTVVAPSIPDDSSPLAHPEAGGNPQVTIPPLLLPIWLTGAGVSLVLLLIGLARLRWIAAGAQQVDRGSWVDLTKDIGDAFGLRRPVALLCSDRSTLLVTWGLVRPKIMLPATAADWSKERARIVLRHELAHIRRGDWAVQMTAEVLRAVFWFNPLVWLACSRLRQESEHACDDAVLDGGVDGTTYAGHLLDLARLLTCGRRAALPASAMARPSSLEGRISAMLNTDRNRKPLTRRSRITTALGLVTLTVLVAGLAAQGSFFTLSGTVLDPTGGVVPKTTVVLTNTKSQAKYEVQSDGTGRFEFVGLLSGDYGLEARRVGFATLKDTVTIPGRNMDRNVELQVGSLEETITIVGQTIALSPEEATARHEAGLVVLQAREQRLQQGRQVFQDALAACAGGNVGPVGGKILPPLKVTDKKPVYPERLKDAKIEGIVTMDALIGTDGNVKEVQALSSPDPDLEAAAVEAVRQWQFTPTLLNCAPIEVRMHVTTKFAIQP